MKVECEHCGRVLNLVGDFSPSEKVFLAGLARYGWQTTSDPHVFICRDCHHNGATELEEFVLHVVAACVELRAEVAELPGQERDAGTLLRFGEVEDLLRAIAAETGLEQTTLRTRVRERLRRAHGDEAAAWFEAVSQRFEGRGHGGMA